MKRIDKKLYETYCAEALRDADSFDGDAVEAYLNTLPLDGPTRNRLLDYCFEQYDQWSAAAFAVGLHLGLSLHHHVCGGCVQQGQ